MGEEIGIKTRHTRGIAKQAAPTVRRAPETGSGKSSSARRFLPHTEGPKPGQAGVRGRPCICARYHDPQNKRRYKWAYVPFTRRLARRARRGSTCVESPGVRGLPRVRRPTPWFLKESRDATSVPEVNRSRFCPSEVQVERMCPPVAI